MPTSGVTTLTAVSSRAPRLVVVLSDNEDGVVLETEDAEVASGLTDDELDVWVCPVMVESTICVPVGGASKQVVNCRK